mgnify:CR=1 FL=1
MSAGNSAATDVMAPTASITLDANITADDYHEMCARADYVLETFGENSPRVALLVDGFVGGPGETQIEADRRMIRQRMGRLRKELEQVRKTRGLHRERVDIQVGSGIAGRRMHGHLQVVHALPHAGGGVAVKGAGPQGRQHSDN